MPALFAHDHRFIPSGTETYSEAQFEASLWGRYLNEFGELVVAGRRGEVPAGKAVSQLVRSSRPGVTFELFPNLSSIRGQVLEGSHSRARIRDLVRGSSVVISRLPSEIGLLAASAAYRLGVPYAIELAGCAWDGLWNHGTLTGKAYAPFLYLRTKNAVARAPFVLYVTKDFLQKRYPAQSGVSVACSDVELPEVSDTALARRYARIQSLGQRRLVLGLIGTLRNRVKGIQTVFAALAKQRRNLPPLMFKVLGGGDSGPWLAEARAFGIADLVRFDGVLPGGDAVFQWLDEVDLYLQPSFKEGLPRALVEAMSRACPAIGTQRAGIPELLDEDCLIRPGDSQALGRLLAQRATDEVWLKNKANSNWKRASQYTALALDRTRGDFFDSLRASAAKKGATGENGCA